MTTPAVNPSPDISFALCINQSVCLSVSSSNFRQQKGFMGRKEEMRDQEIKKLAVIMVVIGG